MAFVHPREAARFPNGQAFDQEIARTGNVRMGARISYSGSGYNVPSASGNSHERDYADFTALVSTATGANRPELFEQALLIVINNGYTLAIADVPDDPPGQRALFVAWVRQSRWARHPAVSATEWTE